MSVGFAMLAHSALDRAADVALYLARSGAPVAVHVDERTALTDFQTFEARIASAPNIYLVPRTHSHWGMWPLVEASLSASRLLMQRHPDLGHIYLISGACLPIQPVEALRRHLEQHKDTDFIESVAIDDARWAVDGLEHERFNLYFPFSWKRHRRLFDAWVWCQRKLRIRRYVPPGITPHMGSQWWCLTTRTLRAIQDDPQFPAFRAYFRKTWIPDESFFQTLARRHSQRLVGESLTLARFGFKGAPNLFYDDHVDLLSESGAFFARKIWPGSDELYEHFLGPSHGRLNVARPVRVAKRLRQSVHRRSNGRNGFYSPGRFPVGWADTGPTAEPFTVLHGFHEVYPEIQAWVSNATGDMVHGRLFAPDGAEFAEGGQDWRAGLSANPNLRDYDPKSFLRNVIWAGRGTHQTFLTSAADMAKVFKNLAYDPHASIYVITGAWALASDADLISKGHAAELQRQEEAALAEFRDYWCKARVRVWSLADVLHAPEKPLRVVLDEHLGRASPQMMTMPKLARTDTLAARLDRWRDLGVPVQLAGDVAVVLNQKAARRDPPKVKE